MMRQWSRRPTFNVEFWYRVSTSLDRKSWQNRQFQEIENGVLIKRIYSAPRAFASCHDLPILHLWRNGFVKYLNFKSKIPDQCAAFISEKDEKYFGIYETRYVTLYKPRFQDGIDECTDLKQSTTNSFVAPTSASISPRGSLAVYVASGCVCQWTNQSSFSQLSWCH